MILIIQWVLFIYIDFFFRLFKLRNTTSLKSTIFTLLPVYLEHKNLISSVNIYLKQLYGYISKGIKDDEQIIQSKAFFCLITLLKNIPDMLQSYLNDIYKLFCKICTVYFILFIG